MVSKAKKVIDQYATNDIAFEVNYTSNS